MTDRYAEKSAQAYRTAQKEALDRGECLAARDRAEKASERKRAKALREVEEGRFANLDDTVVEPTPEWLAKGPVEKFTPRSPDGTVRSVSTVRRVRVLGVARLYAEGKVSMDLYFAAHWYRAMYERAGVEGRYKTSNMSGMPTVSGGINLSQHPMAQHEYEADAREAVRAIQKMLGKKDGALFDGIVLMDMPLRQAARHAKCSTSNLLPRFRDACEDVMRWCEKAGIDLAKFVERNQGA